VLLAEVCDTTYFVSLGYGKHIWDFNMANLPKMLIPLSAKATLAITAEAWSKTSFAITLLRITDGWTKRFVWFAIVSINVLMGLSALLFWVQCKPLSAAWDLSVVGQCWDPKVMLTINQVASCKLPSTRTRRLVCCGTGANTATSLLWRHGYLSRTTPVESNPAPADEA